MRVSVTPVGASLESLTRDAMRDLKAANRRAGAAVASKGKAAMRKGAPVMYGRRLTVKAEVDSWPDRWSVDFFPAKGTAGLWGISESGARPHLIRPRRGRGGRNNRAPALLFGGVFAAAVDHPGTTGHGAWSKAGDRLAEVLDREIVRIYDDALDA